VSVESVVRRAGNGSKRRTAVWLAPAVVAAAAIGFYFAGTVHAANAQDKRLTGRRVIPSKALSLPLFFEPNQGQAAAPVKFLARGAGYGLFLTGDEAVLELRRPAQKPRTNATPKAEIRSVIRMKLEGADANSRVSGEARLPGKSDYFIGNDPAKWRHNIPQYGRVHYDRVYPGIDLVYYGDQGHLEYDFHVAPLADPNQIALNFEGANARIESGDLVLGTGNGEVRFRAPHVYQPARTGSGKQGGREVSGSFRQLGGGRIGFAVGDYDHSRELVIDPVLSYSSYLGGSGTESSPEVAVDAAGLIYVATATDSSDFLFPLSPPAVPPYQATPNGGQDIFIAVLNPFVEQDQQLVYATYLGGSGDDFPAGIQVSTDVDQFTSGIDVIVAGSTSSSDFPTGGVLAAFQAGPPPQPGIHGFVTRLNLGLPNTTLRYSTYLSGTNVGGNATDTVTGLAIDGAGDAFVTGVTTSTNDTSTGFPANPNGFQTVSNAPNQFFATKINTKGTGSGSMIYSTYFGGGNPQGGQTQGGGIAVDLSGNMYITGGTNFLPTVGPNGEAKFPLNLAYQSCLDEASKTACVLNGPTALDGFAAKITPKPGFTLPVYATYLGGSGDDVGYGIAVDSSNNAYITGSTTSSDWISTGSGFQTAYGGNGDAFIAKIGNLSGSSYPLNYFTYLGGSGPDVGQAIQVDSVQSAHVVGTTGSTDLLETTNALQGYGGGGDSFVASISTTAAGRAAGDLLTYLGGSGSDQGTGIALDVFGATYVVGTTVSANFPTQNPYQAALNGSQDAFISKLGANSVLTVAPSTTSPSPNPVAAGTQVAFTFNITNTGPDNASQVTFTALNIPTSGLSSTATAKVTSGSGTCGAVQGSTITCYIPTLAACSTSPCVSATVEVDMTPSITGTAHQIQISGSATANQSGVVAICTPPQPAANIVDFTIAASTSTPSINAGDTATFQVVFTPSTSYGYNGTITPSQTTSPSMVTATAPTFNPTSVTLSGSASATTTLSIATEARPVTSGGLLRRGSFYAMWLPVSGLSLLGLGMGAGRRRRRWLAGLALCVIGGAMLIQLGCGQSSTSTNTGGGTQAGTYTITINGSAGTGAAHSTQVVLTVH
jgi:hypothetical protein